MKLTNIYFNYSCSSSKHYFIMVVVLSDVYVTTNVSFELKENSLMQNQKYIFESLFLKKKIVHYRYKTF